MTGLSSWCLLHDCRNCTYDKCTCCHHAEDGQQGT